MFFVLSLTFPCFDFFFCLCTFRVLWLEGKQGLQGEFAGLIPVQSDSPKVQRHCRPTSPLVMTNTARLHGTRPVRRKKDDQVSEGSPRKELLCISNK